MGTSSKQVMDIKVTKGLASVGNEELRDWTEKGWNQAMREGTTTVAVSISTLRLVQVAWSPR